MACREQAPRPPGTPAGVLWVRGREANGRLGQRGSPKSGWNATVMVMTGDRPSMSSPSLSISLSPSLPLSPLEVWVGSPGKPAFQLASAHHDALCLEDRLVLCEQVSDPKNSSQTCSEVWICRKPLRQDICPAVESSLGPVRDGGFHNREWDSEKMSMQLSLLPMVQRQHPQNCTICDSKTRRWSPQKSRVDE